MEKYPILLDMHTHSVKSGHGTTDFLEELIEYAPKAGLQILGISDHGPATQGSVDSSYFRSLKSVAPAQDDIQLFYGVELNIINLNGEVDLEDDIISTLDYAIISIHPPALTPYEHNNLTDTYIAAMNHPKVCFLGHIDDARFPVDFKRLLTVAKEKGIYPEINNGSLNPNAYRVNGSENCRKILQICKDLNLPVLLSSDSHGKRNLGNMEYIYPLLEECDFPTHLVINSQPTLLKKILTDIL